MVVNIKYTIKHGNMSGAIILHERMATGLPKARAMEPELFYYLTNEDIEGATLENIKLHREGGEICLQFMKNSKPLAPEMTLTSTEITAMLKKIEVVA